MSRSPVVGPLTRPETAQPAAAAGVSGAWTFAFVDLVGFTELTEQQGDAAAATLAQRLHTAALRAGLGGTRVVKTLGDGVLLVAATPAAMLRAVSELLDDWRRHERALPARAGIHHGGAVRLPEGGDYVGSGVNVAARVTALARPGQVLMTAAVAPAAAFAGYDVAYAQRASLRGLAGPVDLYALG